MIYIIYIHTYLSYLLWYILYTYTHTSHTPALLRQRREDLVLKASLGYLVSPRPVCEPHETLTKKLHKLSLASCLACYRNSMRSSSLFNTWRAPRKRTRFSHTQKLSPPFADLHRQTRPTKLLEDDGGANFCHLRFAKHSWIRHVMANSDLQLDCIYSQLKHKPPVIPARGVIVRIIWSRKAPSGGISACLLSLSLASSSIPLWRDSFPSIRTSFFRIPTKTKDQELPGNPPGLQPQTGTAELSSFEDREATGFLASQSEAAIVILSRSNPASQSNKLYI